MKFRFLNIIFTIFLLSFINCAETFNYEEYGEASYYANLFIGRETANGEIFSQDSLTAAHRSLPFGTKVLITNVQNRNSIIVTINDRGPFMKDRIIDVTRRAADSLKILRQGTANVKINANISEEELAKMDH